MPAAPAPPAAPAHPGRPHADCPLPTSRRAFIGASRAALLIGIITSLSGRFPPLQNREKGYFAMAYLLSLSAAVAVQKNGRDVTRATPADVPGT